MIVNAELLVYFICDYDRKLLIVLITLLLF